MIYTVYFIILAVFAFLGTFKIKGVKRILPLYVLAFLLLVFHDGFRWEVGTDWAPYYNYFEHCTSPEAQSLGFEVGYSLLNKIVYLLTGNYSVFLILHACILYIAVFIFCKQYSLYPILSIFLYYCLLIGNLGMNRQFLALVFVFISIRYIIERDLIKFLLCIIVGFFFHNSIILFLPAYIIGNKELSTKSIIIILSLSVGIYLSGIINRIPDSVVLLLPGSLQSKYDIYTSMELQTISIVNILLGLLIRMSFLLILLVFRKNFVNSPIKDRFNVFFNLYLVSIVMYIIFNGSILQIVVSRGVLYYNIVAIIIIPYILALFKGNANKILCFLLIIAYAGFMMIKNMNAFLSTAGDIFRPYTSILF